MYEKQNVTYRLDFVLLGGPASGERSEDGGENLSVRGKDRRGNTRTADEHDFVRTVRFVVLDDASVSPTLDINELVALGDEERDATLI